MPASRHEKGEGEGTNNLSAEEIKAAGNLLEQTPVGPDGPGEEAAAALANREAAATLDGFPAIVNSIEAAYGVTSPDVARRVIEKLVKSLDLNVNDVFRSGHRKVPSDEEIERVLQERVDEANALLGEVTEHGYLDPQARGSLREYYNNRSRRMALTGVGVPLAERLIEYAGVKKDDPANCYNQLLGRFVGDPESTRMQLETPPLDEVEGFLDENNLSLDPDAIKILKRILEDKQGTDATNKEANGGYFYYKDGKEKVNNRQASALMIYTYTDTNGAPRAQLGVIESTISRHSDQLPSESFSGVEIDFAEAVKAMGAAVGELSGKIVGAGEDQEHFNGDEITNEVMAKREEAIASFVEEFKGSVPEAEGITDEELTSLAKGALHGDEGSLKAGDATSSLRMHLSAIMSSPNFSFHVIAAKEDGDDNVEFTTTAEGNRLPGGYSPREVVAYYVGDNGGIFRVKRGANHIIEESKELSAKRSEKIRKQMVEARLAIIANDGQLEVGY